MSLCASCRNTCFSQQRIRIFSFPFPSPFFVCTRNVCANKAAVAALLHPFNKDAPAAICPSQPTAHFNLYNGCAFVSPI